MKQEPKKFCMGKTIYESEEKAQATAEHQMKENDAPPLRAYWCGACYKWHLTKRVK